MRQSHGTNTGLGEEIDLIHRFGDIGEVGRVICGRFHLVEGVC